MKAAGFPPLSRRSPAASLSPLRARPRARPIWAGARGDTHSSAQGPPGLETPTEGEHEEQQGEGGGGCDGSSSSPKQAVNPGEEEMVESGPVTATPNAACGFQER
jgi:hypothetical protein